MTKLLHFQLTDGLRNKKTLIVRQTEWGSLSYILFGGHGSSGTPFAVSNLQVDLPIEIKEHWDLSDLRDILIYRLRYYSPVEVKRNTKILS